MIEHPGHEILARFVEKRLAVHERECVVAHIASCDSCLAAVASLKRVMASKPATRRLMWWAAAAVWLIAIAAGFAVPLRETEESTKRTYVHIDFQNIDGFILAEGQVQQVTIGNQVLVSAGAVRTDGWWIVSVKLPQPVTIGEDCTMRVEMLTNAGYCVASLFPLGKDAALVRLDSVSREWTTVTANVDRAPKAGTQLKPGDRVDRVTIGVPVEGAEPRQLLVRAIELRAAQ
jgi:hypothetical protein